MNKLYDANGDEIPTAACACGRPKLAAREFCCAGCPGDPSREHDNHAAGCSMRCATMGVPGFGVRATAERRGEYRVIPVDQSRLRFEATVERDGADARHSGELVSANPYDSHGPRKGWHNAWRRGWERG